MRIAAYWNLRNFNVFLKKQKQISVDNEVSGKTIVLYLIPFKGFYVLYINKIIILKAIYKTISENIIGSRLAFIKMI